jgi:hypothetical protein
LPAGGFGNGASVLRSKRVGTAREMRAGLRLHFIPAKWTPI